MNREIKFRAFYDSNMHYMTGACVILERFFRVTPETATIMQYTGLKDKNGKEIYEGDICVVFKTKNTPGITHEVVCNLGAFGYIASFDCFISFAENSHFEFDYSGTSMHIEVISNIHESSELLQQKQHH